MKVFDLYDQGSFARREDGKFLCDPFLGVLDGVSAPYSPAYPQKMFPLKGGVELSGGEFVSRFTEYYFLSKAADRIRMKNSNVEEIMEKISCAAAYILNWYGVQGDAGESPGVTFAIAEIGNNYVDVVQAGDCFALWELENGLFGITRNQVRNHDTAMNSEIERIQWEVARELFGVALEDASEEQHGKIRGEMWNRFCLALKEARRQDANNPESPRCYGLLNGDSRLAEVMFKKTFLRSELRIILLFSDGMVPWEVMKDKSDVEVAEQVYADYKKGGLPYMLQVARGIERRVANVNYVDSAEATAIALDFSDEYPSFVN